MFAPCGHEPPQGNSQLHGVCVFCYRDRLGKAQAEVARLGMVIEALRHTSTEGNWARVIERDARRMALEEAREDVQAELDDWMAKPCPTDISPKAAVEISLRIVLSTLAAQKEVGK